MNVALLFISKGSHLSWLGTALSVETSLETLPVTEYALSISTKEEWAAEGRIRYNQDCRFSALGAVNAVPESFSVYSP